MENSISGEAGAKWPLKTHLSTLFDAKVPIKAHESLISVLVRPYYTSAHFKVGEAGPNSTNSVELSEVSYTEFNQVVLPWPECT